MKPGRNIVKAPAVPVAGVLRTHRPSIATATAMNWDSRMECLPVRTVASFPDPGFRTYAAFDGTVPSETMATFAVKDGAAKAAVAFERPPDETTPKL